MEQNPEESMWEGKVSAKLPATTADEAWSLLSDFCSLNKWLPLIDICRRVDGVDGQQGCVRYCTAPAGDEGKPTMWANEELLSVDPAGRCYRYKITESNMGFREYVATLAVLPEGEGDGCSIQWSFKADPIKGWTEEGFVSYMTTGVEAMASRIEEVVKVAPVTHAD